MVKSKKVKSKKLKMGRLSPPLDVSSSESIPAFEDMLQNGPMAIVLVYATWCGHCDRYKENVWSPLKSTANRKMNMASINYEQLENTSLKGSKIDGYPSLLVVGRDKKPATFNSDNGVTNAMPNSNNLDVMTQLVQTPVEEEEVTNVYNESNSLMLSPNEIEPPNISSDNVSTLTRAYENNITNNSLLDNNVENNMGNSLENNSSVRGLANENSLENSLRNSLVNDNSRTLRRNNNSGTFLNTPTNIPSRTSQGTTPILSGGRLYNRLTTRKHKSKKSRKN